VVPRFAVGVVVDPLDDSPGSGDQRHRAELMILLNGALAHSIEVTIKAVADL
jgi:hypothetical protein